MNLALKLLNVLANARFAAAAAALTAGLLLQPVIIAADDTPPTPPPGTPESEEAAVAAEGDAQADGEATTAEEAAAEPVDLGQQWGIEVTSIRLTANDHMIDFRYRVLDPAKAKELFVRQNKPALIHQETGKVLAVPETAKTGPLRNSNDPKAGKIYWMFFGNAGNLVHAGDEVTVVIGEFRVEDLVVE